MAPKEEGTCPQEQPCKQRLRERGENGVNGTVQHVTPCDTPPGSTTAVGTHRQAQEQAWGSVRSQVERSRAVGWGGYRPGPH